MPALDGLRGARLFITGGTGFFGIWLLESLAAANARLDLGIRATVLSRRPDAFRARAPHLAASPIFDWRQGDVRSFEFPPGSYSHVIHAGTAASAALNAEQPGEMFDTIVGGTRRTLEFARSSGASDILFISSGAVYGAQPPALGRIPESHVAAPGGTADAYGDGKRDAEKLCAEAARHGMRPRIARCFAFVGPHLPLDAHFAVGNFLRDARDGRQITVSGDGTPYRSYLHAADLVAWLVTILVRGVPLRAYNVGSDQSVSIADLARRISLLAKPPVQVTISRTATGEPAQRYVPEIDRARRDLGLDVSIGLDAALRRTFDWLCGQPGKR